MTCDQRDVDKYGRIDARCLVGDVDVNESLVRAGLAPPAAEEPAPAAAEPATSADTEPVPKPTPRAGTKQAQMIDLLKRPEAATVEQIAEATGWN